VALFTQDSIDRVKAAVDMADLVGTRTELRRSGPSSMQGLCPFHDERSPSFSVNVAEKVYHCFGCGVGGDCVRFVQEQEGLDFKATIEFLAGRYGVELELAQEDPRDAQLRQKRERLLELLERTAVFYVRYLWDSDEAAPAREYLAGRGLDEASLREFRVGYAPSAWDKVLLASRRTGFSDRELVEAGLAQRAKGEGRTFDRFRRRIMFPLCDTRGRVLGFGARAMGADQKPKYVNSSDNDVYHKGRHLFGADIARGHAARAGTVLLAEGYTDVIALHQAGLRNTVGLMGTALTEEQVGELSRLAPVVLLALDADSAGQEAMLRAAQVAAGRKLELRVVPLPAGTDPADLVASAGAEAVTRLAERSVPFVRFRVERVLDSADLTSAEGKDRAIDALRPVFDPRTLPPSAMRGELERLVANRTDLQPSLVSSWLSAPGGSGGGGAGRTATPAVSGRHGRAAAAEGGAEPARPDGFPRQRAGLDAAGKAERAFLAQCLAMPDHGREVLTALDVRDTFTSDLLRRAAEHVRDNAGKPGDASLPEDEELAGLMPELTVRAAEQQPSRAALEAESLKLEMARVERHIAAARSAGAGDVAMLAGRRRELQTAVNQAVGRAMEETQDED
jgi:DNA primase